MMTLFSHAAVGVGVSVPAAYLPPHIGGATVAAIGSRGTCAVGPLLASGTFRSALIAVSAWRFELCAIRVFATDGSIIRSTGIAGVFALAELAAIAVYNISTGAGFGTGVHIRTGHSAGASIFDRNAGALGLAVIGIGLSICAAHRIISCIGTGTGRFTAAGITPVGILDQLAVFEVAGPGRRAFGLGIT